jgi:hypothetical protein
MALCSFLAILLTFLPVVSAQDYEITLHRKAKVGQQHRMVSSGYESEKTTVTSGDQVIQQTALELTVDLTALVTVLETNELGQTTRARIVVEQSLVRKEDGSNPIVDPGTELVAFLQDRKDVFTVKGGAPVAEDIAKALSVVFQLPKSTETDDDIFGTATKKKPGDAWPINAEVAARSIGETGLAFRKDQVKGETALKGVVKVGDQECLDVRAWFAFDAASVALPGGFTVQDGGIEAQFSGKFPMRKDLPALEGTKELNLRIRATGRPDRSGPEMILEIASVKKETTQRTIVSAGK